MQALGTALVVEDHPGVMALTVVLLQGQGWSVLEARSAAEAHRLLAGQGVDVVISDVSMPGGTGEVPTYGSDAHGRRPGVVYMSGDTKRAALRGQPGIEGATFLEKPFEPEALLAAVSDAAAR